MIISSILLILASFFALGWLLSGGKDTWIMLEIKLIGFFLVTLALSLILDLELLLIVPILIAIFIVILIPLNHVNGLRRRVSDMVYKQMRSQVPKISETERSVIDSGDLSWEQDIFRGNYSHQLHQKIPKAKLTAEEQKFLENETEELCKLCSQEDIVSHRGMPPAALDYIKKKKFWGMIIPKSRGGLEFSASAQAEIISKLASRSPALAVIVMVPNSLGPGELLMHYGTEKQKKYYMPRLAEGKEIPCFALTSSVVGSDAGGLQDFGIVCEKTIDGKKMLGIVLSFDKRYISLAPLATIIGIAFRAYDPDGLLKPKDMPEDEEYNPDLGISCALMPRNAPGIDIGRRHNPLDVLFHNGPVRGKDVFIPIEDVIGGPDYLGKGWQMLMECLSIGRGISLPALSNGGAQLSSWSSAAYTHIRQQFGLPVAKFEGVAERLGQLAINSYLIQSVTDNASAMVTHGLKPAISSAMAKFYTTDLARESCNIAFDVHGGKAIMKGSKNYLSELYAGTPIGITVEGSNILTRSLIIFGQGFLRCHPYLRDEAEAFSVEGEDGEAKGKEAFHNVLWQHMLYIIKTKCRAYTASWSGGLLIKSSGGKLSRFHRRLATLSAQYAFIVELVLMLVGGEIKRKESLSGRFADAWLAMQSAICVIRKWENDGESEETRDLVRTILVQQLNKSQLAMIEILDNMVTKGPAKIMLKLVKVLLFPLGNNYEKVKDRDLLHLARLMDDPVWVKKHLAPIIYIGDGNEKHNPLVDLREAYDIADTFFALRKKTEKEGHAQEPYEDLDVYLAKLVKQKVITKDNKDLWQKADKLIREVVAVDDFEAI